MASHNPNTIESLPNHILSEVLARVSSSSLSDLYTLKTYSKQFLNLIEEDDYIYQHVCMQKLPYIPWFITPQESSFLSRCRENGNPESLYREGMVQYFSSPLMNLDSGLERLKEASEKGHAGAIYVYGMILLCSEVEEERKRGIELLHFLGKCKCMKACRNKVKACLEMMWINDRIRILFGNNNNNGGRWFFCGSNMCSGLQEIKRLERGWRVLDEQDEVISCELCRWDYELSQFSKMCC